MKSWTIDEIQTIYDKPLLDLVFEAATIHREHNKGNFVQKCTLLSIKTGACPEDCSYCPQSSRHAEKIPFEPLMEVSDVLEKAKEAQEGGSTRFCMGAAWREVRDNKDFDKVIEMVKGVKQLGLECCVTLGMLNESQAKKLKEAGLTAYNHNVDTSEEYYPKIISTRTYQDRLDTLEAVGNAEISVCCGGIIGLGETPLDRIKMLYTLTRLKTIPESIPINALVPCQGTPLESQKKIKALELIRMIATTRIVFPLARVRLSAGRESLSLSEQALAFLAGANSIFTGEKLLTTPNPSFDKDAEMFSLLGLESIQGD